MSDLKEFWGMMNVLDNADDVAIFVVSGRDQTLLYCNHLVTVLTNAHTGSPVSQVWDMEDYRKANTRCNEGGTYRYVVEKSAFGKRRNVTVSKVVWSSGILAYSFLITAHVDDKEEEERDKIFNLLGRNFRHIYLIDMMKGDVTTLIKPVDGGEGHYRAVYYHPVSFDEWRRDMIEALAHPDDREQLRSVLDPAAVRGKLEERGDYAFQYRQSRGDVYHWTELRFRKLDEIKGKIVCTERDVQGEISLSDRERANEAILSSLSNAYRSIYLLDMANNEYSTVKADALLFGTPKEGNYDTLLQIVSEFIPDSGQKRDLAATFSAKALAEALSGDVDNVVREYASAINEGESWMSITAFMPPYMQGMEDKCVLTFMDITENKRVEAERNEKNIIVDVLSARYRSVYFVDLIKGTYHSIQIPQEYRYIEKQFKTIDAAMDHYAKAYVLEQYRDIFKNSLSRKEVLAHKNDHTRREYVYRTVEDTWIRLHIYPLSDEKGHAEAILIFEDFTDVMVQREVSLLYNAVLLADYDYMYEYDIDTDMIYSLQFNGERLIREKSWDSDLHSDEFKKQVPIHPDDLPLFLLALSKENLDDAFAAGKTVSHMFFRRKVAEDSEYRLFMYGMHYFEDMGKRRVLIMARDSEREVM
ncbi:MAG: hypothetical protein IKR23_05600 [Lachnospiraceae bacterium]|nr:hypothetical protein [Lachnospiraceae bacterium]